MATSNSQYPRRSGCLTFSEFFSWLHHRHLDESWAETTVQTNNPPVRDNSILAFYCAMSSSALSVGRDAIWNAFGELFAALVNDCVPTQYFRLFHTADAADSGQDFVWHEQQQKKNPIPCLADLIGYDHEDTINLLLAAGLVKIYRRGRATMPVLTPEKGRWDQLLGKYGLHDADRKPDRVLSPYVSSDPKKGVYVIRVGSYGAEEEKFNAKQQAKSMLEGSWAPRRIRSRDPINNFHENTYSSLITYLATKEQEEEEKAAEEAAAADLAEAEVTETAAAEATATEAAAAEDKDGVIDEAQVNLLNQISMGPATALPSGLSDTFVCDGERLAGLKVRSQKAMSISQYTKIRSNRQVIEASKGVQTASKRKFSAEPGSKRKKVDEKAARITRRKSQLQEESKRNDE